MNTTTEWTLTDLPLTWEVRNADEVLAATAKLIEMAASAAGEAQLALEAGDHRSATGAAMAGDQILEDTGQGLQDTAEALEAGNPQERMRLARGTEQLDENAQNCLEALRNSGGQILNPPRNPQERRWLAQAHTQIAGQKIVRTIADADRENEQRKRNRSPEDRERSAQLIQKMGAYVLNRENQEEHETGQYETDEEETGQPFHPELAKRAEDARNLMRADIIEVLGRYNQGMRLRTSESMNGFQGLTNQIEHTIIPATGCITGFVINEEATEVAPWIAFIDGNERHVKAVTDPYPPGFDRQAALGHMDTVRATAVDIAVSREQDDIITTTAIGALIAMSAAVELNLHTLTGQQIQAVRDAAAEAGLAEGAQAALVKALRGNSVQADMYINLHCNNATASTSLDNAREVTETARRAGVDNHALAEIARAMGHSPETLGIEAGEISVHQARRIVENAVAHGMPQTVASRMMNTIQETQDQGSGSQDASPLTGQKPDQAANQPGAAPRLWTPGRE